MIDYAKVRAHAVAIRAMIDADQSADRLVFHAATTRALETEKALTDEEMDAFLKGEYR